ncbi:3-ketoacyl-ACP reductase [Acetobacter tropicalis NRIC 0312]|uniref:3-ketoacyl-ACP reductase n=1 Tax=Acetobacter tropicalis TaxID=104102 RepID=A0A511FMY5_9PROT|nr:3-ketoacyl-ACP reductase [Acetobacter tropicalis]KXV47352.1 3-ketoacyl-ACP reductase [Acetobacter tropicalis]GAL99253.1 3-ketoacyl-ACP reductase [Acetobacter tropicalis]GBR67120.1 3-ketoacyl-ACP reductase [Acetobacter tropicalis NRIC 0312]GEL50301.1 3-ketoacyl-ACP reductase [Acetobacter tropicalis]
MRQVALVTGSSRGIGLATAEVLAKAGFAVALNGPEDNEELKSAVAKVSEYGGPVVAAPFDVTDCTEYAAKLSCIEDTLGPLTTLVNNAGVGVLQRGDLLDVTEASWERCVNVNAKALFFLSQSFARRLVSRKRDDERFYSIVNVTSSNAVAVAVQRSEYCASKAAAAMISRTLAVRLGAENIAVYDVQPGLIATEMTAPVIESYQKRAEDGLTLFPRVGTPAEIGAIITSLATGKLPYVTGQAISADAGMLIPRF